MLIKSSNHKEKTVTSSTQIANTFNKQFTNTIKHKTKRHFDRKTLKLQTSNITFTTTQVQAARKHIKNNNSTGPDKVNIRHLKHIGPLGLAYLTNMYNTSLNNNIIPHTWKLANIIPIPKPNRHEHRHIIQTHLTSLTLSDSKHTGEDTTPIHHKQHLHTTWLFFEEKIY